MIEGENNRFLNECMIECYIFGESCLLYKPIDVKRDPEI